MGRKVLVAGGAGFLGAHLCRRLLNDGHEVICLDDLSTGRVSNIEDMIGQARFRFVEQDVCEPFDGPADVICNLACPASPRFYQADPVATMRTCVVGAMTLLNQARRTGAAYVQASTSEVYGDPQSHPQAEDYWGHVNPAGPRACYDEGKRAAEALCADFHRRHGVRVKVARIFNTYGPGMRADDGRVVCTWIVQALKGEPLSLFGDGRQTRSFCYVDDLIEGWVRLMDEPGDDPAPVNLGMPVETTLTELAERIRTLTGGGSAMILLPRPADDPHRRRPDIARARARLGWEPTTPLDEGLRATIAWFARPAAERDAA